VLNADNHKQSLSLIEFVLGIALPTDKLIFGNIIDGKPNNFSAQTKTITDIRKN
jgi:hypothetical protein